MQAITLTLPLDRYFCSIPLLAGSGPSDSRTLASGFLPVAD